MSKPVRISEVVAATSSKQVSIMPKTKGYGQIVVAGILVIAGILVVAPWSFFFFLGAMFFVIWGADVRDRVRAAYKVGRHDSW